MSISAPVIAFAVVGGFLGRVMAREDTYQHLKIFDDVVSLISSSYVEEADIDKVMRGAMHGLAEGLDPDSAYLTADQVRQVESGAPLAPGGVGLELTRQYYLRVIAARDNSPAAKAGLRTGDYIRAINEMPTREMSVWEGVRALRGTPGSKVSITIIRGNAADPHVLELTRENEPASVVNGRMAGTGIGYVRIAGIGQATAGQVTSQIADLTKGGASKLIVDVRRASNGTIDDGIALARLFVGQGGTLAFRESKGGARETIAAASGDGAVTLPTVVLIDTGTSGGGGDLRGGARREQARRSHRRAHDRAGRVPEAREAARRRRLVAVHDALPHPVGRAAARKRARADGRRRRTRRRVRPAGTDGRPHLRQGGRATHGEKSRVTW